MGKYVGKIPNVGIFFMFLKQPIGYFICIFIPFLLLILYEGITCIKFFRRYKKEQMVELEAERTQIEEKRKQAAEMMKELQELKEKLSMQTAGASSENSN